MERKKLLLVAVSVGVVLLIILIIPLLVIRPKQDFESSWQEQSAIIEPPNMTQGWNNLMETDVAPAAEVPDEIASVSARGTEFSGVTTITIPTPRTVAVPDTPVGPARQPAAIRPAHESPKESKPQVAAKPAAVKPAEKPDAVKPAPTTSPKTETVKTNNKNSDFWIQTGAFSTKKYAEGAMDYLAARGITSIIEDPVINGKTWYRVRVGPYMTRDEANYWLALVKSIDGFAGSQVWETAAR